MTDHTNAELVKLASILSDPNFSLSVPEEAKRVIRTLAERLEAAERERDNWKLSAEEAERVEKYWLRRASLAERRADAAREEVGYEKRMREFISGERDRFIDLTRAAEQERNQLAAVVEKVLSHDPLHGADSGLHCGGMAPCIRDILSTAPTEALREHDAAIIEGLADEFAARLPDGTGNGRVYNSHTVARMLREKARQRREEKG